MGRIWYRVALNAAISALWRNRKARTMAAISRTEQHSSGCLLPIIIVLAAATILLLALPLDLPRMEDISPRPHAVERHGTDAESARSSIRNCGTENLRVRLCPPSSQYGLSVIFWCSPPGATLCPGCITTISGLEKTAFTRPCGQWALCR